MKILRCDRCNSERTLSDGLSDADIEYTNNLLGWAKLQFAALKSYHLCEQCAASFKEWLQLVSKRKDPADYSARFWAND